ncbi:MAG TPA: insulinase family protein [Thermoanaerobaculia bacterium]|nr:insulinase family protein [Thermoanaerobaculia bacterium]
MKRTAPLSLLLALLLTAGSAFAASVPAPPEAQAPMATAPTAASTATAIAPERLLQQLPFDKNIIKGKLDNGLTYYVKRNDRPAKRAEVWLAVDAGSVLEDENQRGLAHFIEHMAFNGTRRFAKMELVNYLESIGMQFGADVNAHTGFDETVYTLRVPTDRPEVMDKAFDMLEDWASGVTFDPEEVDKERGVVIEEWRLGLGADGRIRDKQFPILFKGSRYAERLPIGTLEVLQKTKAEDLKRFYRDWYRPELMAVVVVGDVDPAKAEALVKKHFGGLRNPEKPRKREVFPVPDDPKTRIAITTDPEATDTSVSIYSIVDKRPEGTVGDYRNSLIEQLYHDMLNARLREMTQKPDLPFRWAASASGKFVRTRDVLFQTVAVPEGGTEEGLQALLTEIERVHRHGFTPGELDRSKKEMALFYEQASEEQGKLDSANFAAEYLRNYFEDEPVPGIAYEAEVVREVLPSVRLDEVNRLAEHWISGGNRVILLSAPEVSKPRLPQENQLLNIFQTVAARNVEPYVDTAPTGPLVAETPRPARLVSESRIAELGIIEWRLSNGVRVILKPTDFQNDEILLGAFSPGGRSLVSDDDYLSALFAPALLREAGLGRFDQVELEKALAGKAAAAMAYIGEYEEGVRATASGRDLETMLQLVYLHFTEPRKDLSLYLSVLAGMQEHLKIRQADPESVFQERLAEAVAQGDPRQRPLTLERVHEIDLEDAYKIYRQRFADAADFTFILVGNFKPEAIQPQVLTWLGGLPSKGKKETWREIGQNKPPRGVVKVEVEKGLDPKSEVRIAFTGPAEFSRENRHAIDSLARILQIRLREILREDMGAVYGVAAEGELVSRPNGQYSFTIGFGCAPEKVDSLVQAVFAEIESIQKNGVPEVYIQRVREQERRERELAERENRFWLDALESYYGDGLDPRTISRYGELVEQVTPERMREAAQSYLPRDRYILGVLRPEVKPAEQPATVAAGAPEVR